MASIQTAEALTYRNITINSLNISYIEAGAQNLPTLLLLSGFPSSANQFRKFIPLLAPYYHVIAPSYPGFGQSDRPADFDYTFAKLTDVMAAFLSTLQLTGFAAYVFDYGAPIAYRLALQHPEWFKAIITQNGNAYVDGFGHPFWDPIMDLWKTNNSAAARQTLVDNILTLDGTAYQYTVGVPEKDLPLVDPNLYTADYLENIAGLDNANRQLALFYDYRTNVDLYPKFQEYFRKSQVPLLAVWGKNDPAFIPPGAEAYKRDLPNATVELLDAGHFALETKVGEIAEKVLKFLKGIGY